MAEEPEEEIEVSAPGVDAGESDPAVPEEVVVTGRRVPNVIRATPEVISVLSAEDIARTGEGDIAGALQRVTGLTVVGNGSLCSAMITTVAGPIVIRGSWYGVDFTPRVTISRTCTPSVISFARRVA